MNTEVLILGGGLAGLSTAHHLGGLGVRSRLVVEAKTRAGGTAGSETHGAFTFDYTGHLLHLHDPYGSKFILDLLAGNWAAHERRAWIHSQGADTRYPYQANTRGLPKADALDCAIGFLETVHRPRALKTKPDFLSWSRATFGDGITKRFMKPYNEKLWQTPLGRMTTEWQGRFVPKPSPSEVLYGALAEQNALFGYNSTFRYPKRGGIQALPDALAARLEPGVLRTGCRARSVDLREKVAIVDGIGEVRYERLVNTLPLCDFLDLASPLPADVRAARRALRWNTVWNLNLGVSRVLSDKHWVYYPEKKYPFYRVGYSSNFSKQLAPKGSSAVYIEVARPGGTRVDLPALEASVLRGLRDADVLKKKDEIAVKAWMPVQVGYVVYDFARTPSVTTIFRHLDSLRVQSVGRYGGWKYSFMEETILDGKRAAEKIAGVASAPAGASTAELRPLK